MASGLLLTFAIVGASTPEPADSLGRAIGDAGESARYGPNVYGPARQMAQADLLEACMLERGFPAVRQGIAVGFRVLAEQREYYEAALKDCSVIVDDAFPEPPLLTGSAYYDALVDARECLTGIGYSLPQPPSLDTFLESLSGGSPPWSPYMDLPDSLSQEEWNNALASCPQPAGR